MRHLAALPFLALLAAACAPFATEPAPSLLSADTVGAAAIVDDLNAWPADRLEFHEVRVENDTLVASVSYGGGCREHRFALVFAHRFLESDPVQMTGWLSHDAAGDLCRALLGRTLRYDLTPLRDVYRAAYRTHTGTVLLRGNWPGVVRYDF